MAEILRREIALACPPDHAFRVFTEQFDLWWPRGHRRNRDSALHFDREHLVERLPDGSEWTMASVRAYEPPAWLELDWFPGSPQAPTHVEIAFAPTAEGTTITILHQPLTEAATAIWAQRIAQFIKGWEAVLPALRDYIANTAGDAKP
jgi:Activator of Hsp90 ATPase homolog 1-like protein